MRLISRFLALAVLVVVAAFTNVVSPVSKCFDCDSDCLAVLQKCNEDCKGNQSCREACIREDVKCKKKCGPAMEEGEN